MMEVYPYRVCGKLDIYIEEKILTQKEEKSI